MFRGWLFSVRGISLCFVSVFERCLTDFVLPFVKCSKVVSNVGAVKASFLSGRALRMTKVAAASKGDMTISAVAAPQNERPLWFPGSQAPEWLDGRYFRNFPQRWKSRLNYVLSIC